MTFYYKKVYEKDIFVAHGLLQKLLDYFRLRRSEWFGRLQWTSRSELRVNSWFCHVVSCTVIYYVNSSVYFSSDSFETINERCCWITSSMVSMRSFLIGSHHTNISQLWNDFIYIFYRTQSRARARKRICRLSLMHTLIGLHLNQIFNIIKAWI